MFILTYRFFIDFIVSNEVFLSSCLLVSVLRIRDVNPGSELFSSRICFIKFKYFNPKKWFLNSRKYDPGCSSRIRILTSYPSRIQGLKRHRIPDPDPQHWLVCTLHICFLSSHLFWHMLYILIEPLYLGFDVDTILNSIKISFQYI